MPLLEIATTDRVITITPFGGWTPGVPVYTETPSTKAKCNNKGIIIGIISWTLAPGACVLPGWAHGGGKGSISPTCIKVKETILNDTPIRINDTGQCSGSFITPGGFAACQCQFTVTDAGQIKAKAQ